MRLKKDRESNIKDADKLKHQVKNLNCILTLKLALTRTLDQKLSGHSNNEIESILKCKRGSSAERKKTFQFQRWQY